MAFSFSRTGPQESWLGDNLRPTADAWLKYFCEAGVGKCKMPKTIDFIDDLPKRLSGKILRLRLPELIARVTADN